MPYPQLFKTTAILVRHSKPSSDDKTPGSMSRSFKRPSGTWTVTCVSDAEGKRVCVLSKEDAGKG